MSYSFRVFSVAYITSKFFYHLETSFITYVMKFSLQNIIMLLALPSLMLTHLLRSWMLSASYRFTMFVRLSVCLSVCRHVFEETVWPTDFKFYTHVQGDKGSPGTHFGGHRSTGSGSNLQMSELCPHEHGVKYLTLPHLPSQTGPRKGGKTGFKSCDARDESVRLRTDILFE